ncbi:UNVERIFIED_CONTAM: hypothetical protein Sradi_1633300 [Sesamum radiatum]|uniref:Uncharacterized protein n=1 Tax=Sesamum radiatum TaxID=300843 RepID=A0AAW2UEI9_SESRA
MLLLSIHTRLSGLSPLKLRTSCRISHITDAYAPLDLEACRLSSRRTFLYHNCTSSHISARPNSAHSLTTVHEGVSTSTPRNPKGGLFQAPQVQLCRLRNRHLNVLLILSEMVALHPPLSTHGGILRTLRPHSP